MKSIIITLVLFLVFSLSGCAFLRQPPEALPRGERLNTLRKLPALPVVEGSKLLWNEYQVPYIVAESDRDGAFLFGLAQAHLRLGQMELLKRVGSGRLTEIAGPFVHDIDVAIRALGISRTAKTIYKEMPSKTREWLDAFTAGINFYKEHLGELPPDFAPLGFDNSEAWQPEDSIVIARLTGADINWFTMLGLLKLREEESYQRLYQLMEQTAKWGSNSVVIDAKRSVSGSPLIANDPHLGFSMPNFWIIAGLKTPTYHMVGMAVPGTPVFGFGRTPFLAWGGTNMRGWSSDFVDVTDLPSTEITTRTESFVTRWWLDDEEDIRVTPYGPIISDLDIFDFPEGIDVALRWIGSLPIDDITPFLEASQAKNAAEFEEAFRGYALPALNILYADRNGNTGHLLATTLPTRKYAFPKDLWQTMKASDQEWSTLQNALTLPQPDVPHDGILSSSNNNPIPGKLPAVGWFFSPDTRAERARTFLNQKKKITLQDLTALQQDVYSVRAVAFRDELLVSLKELSLSKDEQELVKLLDEWDGNYSVDSRGALLIEALFKTLADEIYSDREEEKKLLGRGQLLRSEVLRSLKQSDEKKKLLRSALQEAMEPFREGTTWGDIHRLTIGHVLSSLPLIGERYVLDEVPTPGSRQTFMKSAHELTTEKHRARFGSQSRHISDLSDPDANYFVLLGGQDGFIGSENFADQYELWREGRYIQLPLTEEEIAKSFSVVP